MIYQNVFLLPLGCQRIDLHNHGLFKANAYDMFVIPVISTLFSNKRISIHMIKNEIKGVL